MKAAVGQRWLFKGKDWDMVEKSFVCEVTRVGDIHYKVVQLIKQEEYHLGQEIPYGAREFDTVYWTYLDGQDAPK